MGLWSLAILCAAVVWESRRTAAAAEKSAAIIGQSTPAPQPPEPATSDDTGLAADEGPAAASRNGILGRLEIPALHLTTPIVDDYDTKSLLRGAGHIRGTAMPGGLGNFVVAAHRDTYFRPLSGIQPGMKIRIVTPEETFVYLVDSTKIVTPDNVDVLDIGDVPQMTLITCYPFHYIGAAPKRFVVFAHLSGF